MSNCGICGEPMPPGEEMFKYHGYSGDCPKHPLAAQRDEATMTEDNQRRASPELEARANAAAGKAMTDRETPWKPCTHDDSSWCTEDCLPPEKRSKGLLDRRETPRDPDLIEGDPKEFWDRALAELRLLQHGPEMEKRIRQLELSLASAREEIGRLRGFVARLFDLTDWPDGGDLESFDFQDAAVDHGILTPVEVTEPCNKGREDEKHCFCEEYNGADEFPVTCYRKPDWLIECQSANAALSTAQQLPSQTQEKP